MLGTGCTKCNKLENNAKEAIKEAGVDANVEKVDDIDKIGDFGVMITPALAIDGDVKSAGKVLSVDEIIKLIKG